MFANLSHEHKEQGEMDDLTSLYFQKTGEIVGSTLLY